MLLLVLTSQVTEGFDMLIVVRYCTCSCQPAKCHVTVGVDKLVVSSAGTLHSDDFASVYFSAFHLDTTMTTVAAFSVAVSQTMRVYYDEKIKFDVVHVDTHFGWQATDYTVPVSGLWVICLQHGIATKANGFLRVTINGNSNSIARIEFPYLDSQDMTSTTVIAGINAGNTLAVHVGTDWVYSDEYQQTALNGFLYSPINQPAIAWCVSLNYMYVGPWNNLPFKMVQVNHGGGWNVTENMFIAPLAGVYVVWLVGGQLMSNPMELGLVLNKVFAVASVYATATEDDSMHTRSIIIRLNVGDTLHVRLAADAIAEGYTDEVFTAFSGIRLMA